MTTCRICSSGALRTCLELGPQPVASHFARDAGARPVRHDLALGVCTACGVVQLERPFPFADLVPPFEWITYREPEDHLDAVAARIVSLPGLAPDTRILGLTFKDRTTLDRLARQGFANTRILDVRGDLGATSPNANIESVQGLMTPATARRIAASQGRFGLIVVRHILEHAENPLGFMQALDALLAPGGYVAIEVPDCVANLERRDYTMLWEEHATYFTRETLPQVLAAAGLISLGVELHHYPFEDVLVIYARKAAGGAVEGVPDAAVARNIALATAYGAAFGDWTNRYRELFQRLTADGRKLAAYGAGHLTSAFLSFHDVAHFFAFVVDDTPQKQGLHLPAGMLEIVPRSRLDARAISACLFGLAPQIEDKVIANNAAFRDAGGQFYSLFADSPRSIRTLL